MLALILMMPILTMFADIFGIIGGASVGITILDITAHEYWRRTIEKQRELAHSEWKRKRQEKLDAMTHEEREAFIKKEKKDMADTFSLIGSISSHLGDSPYSKL